MPTSFTELPVIQGQPLEIRPNRHLSITHHAGTTQPDTVVFFCHGAGGNSTIAINPKLSAQHPSYIYKQLVNFTTAERNQPVMTTYAKLLTDEEKHNVAAWLGTQAGKPGAAKNKDTIELGKKIYRGGIADKNVPACASCHGASGGGIPVQYPRIAGQHQDYTVAQLGLFKAGGRKNSAQMTTIAQRMSEEEMKAVADYVAGLK